MLIPPEKLVDGCLETLRAEVLPHLEKRSARGQLYAVLDVLQNLRDRIEEKIAPLEDEADSARIALEQIAVVLRDAGDAAAADAVTAEMASAAGESTADRAAALSRTLVSAIDALYALPSGMPEAARRALAAHLGPQAVRDVAPLKPSLLNEISKG